MKTVWNKETRNEESKYYRDGDWGVEVEDDFSRDNFTEISPPEECFNGTPCDWDGTKWVVDTELTTKITKNLILKSLAASDVRMIRGVEDLIQLLIDKGLITVTELPDATQSHFEKRKKERTKLKG